MKYIFSFLFSFVFSGFIFSQMVDTSKIVGIYYFPSGNPEGGSSLIVLPDHTFVQTYFGGMIHGTWKVEANNISFKPYVESDPFVVYVRKTDTLTNTKISFEGFENGMPSYVNFKLNKVVSTKMKRVFNEDANCFSYPYEYEVKGIIEEIHLAVPLGHWHNNQFNKVTFAVDDYNDIVIINNPVKSDVTQFVAQIQANGLQFNGKLVARKELQDIGEEDIIFIKAFVMKKPFEDTIYKNEEHFFVDQTFPIDLKKYSYNKKADRYVLIDQSKKTQIDEETGIEYYERSPIKLLPYRRLNIKNKLEGTIEVQQGSLFIAKCD
ncbi:MAG: hypothetical protein KDC47_03620 [Flavobacteriaceae bacterium]|nr:hypothetical protein [Flavobacteriaceae bacterium]